MKNNNKVKGNKNKYSINLRNHKENICNKNPNQLKIP